MGGGGSKSGRGSREKGEGVEIVGRGTTGSLSRFMDSW